MKYIYDITALLGLLLLAGGIAREFGANWGLMSAGCILLALAVYTGLKANNADSEN